MYVGKNLMWSQKGNFLDNRTNAFISWFMISSDDMFVSVEACYELALIFDLQWDIFKAHVFILFSIVNDEVSVVKSVKSGGILLDQC